MIYLDSNIFIYAAINNDRAGEKSRILIRKLLHEKRDIGTSSLTWDEIIYAIWKKEGKEKALLEGKKFLQFPDLILFKADTIILAKAQELAEYYSLKPRDAIHAATALVNGIKEIASDDPDFDKVKQLKRIKLL